MFKRLALSLVLMGLAAFSLGAGAVAWFSDSATGNVTITADTPDLQFDIDLDCDGSTDYDHTVDGDLTEFDFNWGEVVPGDETADCITVHNLGGDELELYVLHGDFPGNPNRIALMRATEWRYNSGPGAFNNDPPRECPFAAPDTTQYTDGRGCALGTVAGSSSIELRIDVRLPETGTDQNHLAGWDFSMTSTLTGYTD